MIPVALVATAFSRAVSAEIDNRAPLDFETVFEIAADSLHPDSHPDPLALTEALAEALDSMLQSARALA